MRLFLLVAAIIIGNNYYNYRVIIIAITHKIAISNYAWIIIFFAAITLKELPIVVTIARNNCLNYDQPIVAVLSDYHLEGIPDKLWAT